MTLPCDQHFDLRDTEDQSFVSEPVINSTAEQASAPSTVRAASQVMERLVAD